MKIFNLLIIILALFTFTTCKISSDSVIRDVSNPGANQLVNENSPYLLKHAYNPVDWHPWNEASLKKAQDEGKMLLISIGYSACHWCNVMEEESFMDTTLAKFINKHFIPIKVDREERPDIDDIYLTACEVSSGKNCGWPLNALALSDGSPFWAGTYFPKDQWGRILNYMVEENQTNPAKVEAWADDIVNGLFSTEDIPVLEQKPTFSSRSLDQITSKLLKSIDFQNGGSDAEFKFPMPNNYQFLLKNHALTKNEKALDAVKISLDNMALGGIYDHIGGGFSRYSTDAEWKVPHFEKMLYDNSQMVSLYSEAYRLTKNKLYKERVYETLDFISSEMTSSEGAFYSSYDSDVDGEKGKFYVWTTEEINSVISDEDAATLFKDLYNVTKVGNWENGKNVLYMKRSPLFTANKFGLDLADFNVKIAKAKKELKLARDLRGKPLLDDKVLTAWNALMLKGYVDAYRTFNEPEFLAAALKNAQFIKNEITEKDGKLTRNYKGGKAVINGFLDDYALLADAYISLYQVTFDEQWIYEAKKLTDYAMTHFFDDITSTFYYTSDLDAPLVTRKRELTDNVIPGSNSTMAKNLHNLGIYLFDVMYEDVAKNMVGNMLPTITAAEVPNFYTNWAIVLTDFIYEPFEVAIVGANYAQLREELDQTYIPNMLLLGGVEEGTIELLDGKLIKGETTIYVCKNKVCKFPVNTIVDAMELMNE